MSNKTKSRFLRNRTLSRLAALGGTAIIVSSLLMTVAVTSASAAGTGAKTGTAIGDGLWHEPEQRRPPATTPTRPRGRPTTTACRRRTARSTSRRRTRRRRPDPGRLDHRRHHRQHRGQVDRHHRLYARRRPVGQRRVDAPNPDDHNVTGTETPRTRGSATDTWGQVWDPTQLTNANFVAGHRQRQRRRDCNDSDTDNNQSTFASTSSTSPSPTGRSTTGRRTPRSAARSATRPTSTSSSTCRARSASQGDIPSNLPDMITGINKFVTDFEVSGDGKYAATRFNGELRHRT